MDRDDVQIGRLLSRREILALLGASGIAALAGCRPSRETAQVATAGGSAADNNIDRVYVRGSSNDDIVNVGWSDGKIVAAGWSHGGTGSDDANFAVLRFHHRRT